MEALLDTWQINDRINRYLLAGIPAEALGTKLAKGKSVASNFSHIHNVRLMWLKAAAPDLHEGMTKLDGDLSGGVDFAAERERIDAALTASGSAIEELIRRAGSPEGRIKNFRPHASAFVGYIISHESFHRAMAEIALRQAGTPMDDKLAYGVWEWGSR